MVESTKLMPMEEEGKAEERIQLMPMGKDPNHAHGREGQRWRRRRGRHYKILPSPFMQQQVHLATLNSISISKLYIMLSLTEEKYFIYSSYLSALAIDHQVCCFMQRARTASLSREIAFVQKSQNEVLILFVNDLGNTLEINFWHLTSCPFFFTYLNSIYTSYYFSLIYSIKPPHIFYH